MICPVSSLGRICTNVWFTFTGSELTCPRFSLSCSTASVLWPWDKFLNASRTTGLVGRKKKSFICQICWSVFLTLAFAFMEAYGRVIDALGHRGRRCWLHLAGQEGSRWTNIEARSVHQEGFTGLMVGAGCGGFWGGEVTCMKAEMIAWSMLRKPRNFAGGRLKKPM